MMRAAMHRNQGAMACSGSRSSISMASKPSRSTHMMLATSLGFGFTSTSTHMTNTWSISRSIHSAFILAAYLIFVMKVMSSVEMLEGSIPSSCSNFLTAARLTPMASCSSISTSLWSGCEQQALAQTFGKVTLSAERCWSSISPFLLKSSTLNAR